MNKLEKDASAKSIGIKTTAETKEKTNEEHNYRGQCEKYLVSKVRAVTRH